MRVPACKGGLTGLHFQATSLETGKIERSAEALRVRHHLQSLPPTKEPDHNAGWATGRTIRLGMARIENEKCKVSFMLDASFFDLMVVVLAET